MATPFRCLLDQQARHLWLFDRLDAAAVKGDAREVWATADHDREVGWLTDSQHAIVAGRAEELIATLPAALAPNPRRSTT